MPYALLHIKASKLRRLARARAVLRQELPTIIAEELSIEGCEVHEGGLTPAEVMLWPVGSEDDPVINGKDVEIVILAHPFPERIQNIEERKNNIINKLKTHFEEVNEQLTFAVCVILMPMAYGETKVGNLMS